MRTLGIYDQTCSICGREFDSNEILGVVCLPSDKAGAVHLHHQGMRDLAEHPSQIVTGAMLCCFVQDYESELATADQVLVALREAYLKMPVVQQQRLHALHKGALKP